MASKKVQEALKLVAETYVSMKDGAELAGLSEVYFRRQVEAEEAVQGAELKHTIFDKQVIERSVAVLVKERVAAAKAERAEKSAAREAEKAERKTRQQTGPTLIELKYEAKMAGISIGRKNKAELIAAIAEAKAQETEDLTDDS